MSTDEDIGNLRLQQASAGQGNTLAVTANFLLSRRADIDASRTRFFRIVKLADGSLAPQLADWDQVAALAGEARDRKLFIVHKDWESRIPPRPNPSPVPADEDPYRHKLKDYISMAPEDRAAEVVEIRKAIDELKKSDVPPEAKAVAIMQAVEKTFLINKASLKASKADVGIHERTVASETREFVSSVLTMVDESDLGGPLFETFKSLSNGQTLNHVSRVFSMTCGFIHFFNRQHQNRVGQSLRLVFNEHYKERYRKLLPGLEEIRYSADNMVQIASISPPDMKEYALGAFLHDIGKMANLDYFESDAAYNPQEIRQHVFVSSGLVLMNYGNDHDRARLIAGDHHNALFHKDGYGVTRWERERGMRQLKELSRCVTATADEYTSGQALGFLPVEMVAVIDIFDAMTDASRTYKKPMSADEACRFLHDKMVESAKIDPIIFDLFVDFLREQGQAVPDDLGFAAKLARRTK